MLCSMCKTKEAVCKKNVDLGFGVVEVCLCNECAIKANSAINEVQTGIELSNFWTNDSSEVICPNCKLTASEFEKNNYVGCEKCYDVFKPEIERAVTIIHGKSTHVGKVPESVLRQESKKAKLNQLSREMQRIINGKNPNGKDKYLGGGI